MGICVHVAYQLASGLIGILSAVWKFGRIAQVVLSYYIPSRLERLAVLLHLAHSMPTE